MDLCIKYHFLLVAVWTISMLSAYCMNRIEYSYGECRYFYRSGYVRLSIRLPMVVSVLLFLYPYKRRVALGSVVMTSSTYILFGLYHMLNKYYLGFNEGMVAVFLWIEVIIAAVCLLEIMIDAELHTKEADLRIAKTGRTQE